jgi:hypothetical protein
MRQPRKLYIDVDQGAERERGLGTALTMDIVEFDSRYDFAITLRFDPHDQYYPFKGTSGRADSLRRQIPDTAQVGIV